MKISTTALRIVLLAAPPFAYALGRGMLRVLDVSGPADVREVSSLAFEGALRPSRTVRPRDLGYTRATSSETAGPPSSAKGHPCH